MRLRWLAAILLAAIVGTLPAMRAASGALSDAAVLAYRLQVWTQTLAQIAARLEVRPLRS